MYNLREIIEKSNINNSFNGRLLFDEKIAPKTSFKIGGNAPLFAEPAGVNSLIQILNILKKHKVPFFVMGGGTNIVVSDDGFEGAVISTSGLNKIEIIEDADCTFIADASADNDTVLVKAYCGTAMSRLVSFCTEKCISGLEPFAGLPGTVGGAAFMNARCFNLSLSDVFYSAEYLDCDFNECRYDFNKDDWNYKVSPFSKDVSLCGQKIITSVVFRLIKKDESWRKKIEAECSDYIRQRVEKGHFKYPCAGSVFKNNRDFGEPTGKIIDSLGLKGYSIGDAQVAPWHGNIIINRGKATAKDVLALTEFLCKKVWEQKRLRLENEIIFVGKNC